MDPTTAQFNAIRKELKKQRKTQESLRSELETSANAVRDLRKVNSDQELALITLRRDLFLTTAGAAVGVAVLFFLLLIIGFRNRPRASQPDELQRRLATLDRKLQEISPAERLS
jgi:hypothetical protein